MVFLLSFLPIIRSSSLYVYIMKGYGYLFGRIRLIKDTHHDEVFIEETGVVLMRNNQWLFTYRELVAIANEMTTK